MIFLLRNLLFHKSHHISCLGPPFVASESFSAHLNFCALEMAKSSKYKYVDPIPIKKNAESWVMKISIAFEV